MIENIVYAIVILSALMLIVGWALWWAWDAMGAGEVDDE